MRSFDTVVEAINSLRNRGYNTDLNIAFDKLITTDQSVLLHADDFDIVEVHRFEGATNPSDEDVVYGIESKDGKIKGVLTSAFGVYSETMDDRIIQKLSMHIKQ